MVFQIHVIVHLSLVIQSFQIHRKTHTMYTDYRLPTTDYRLKSKPKHVATKRYSVPLTQCKFFYPEQALTITSTIAIGRVLFVNIQNFIGEILNTFGACFFFL